MAILDDPFNQKRELWIQIDALKERLNAATDPAEQQTLQDQIEKLERTREARWPFDAGVHSYRAPPAESNRFMDRIEAARNLETHPVNQSLRHIGPRKSTHKQPPAGLGIPDQPSAMRQGEDLLWQARAASGEEARKLFQNAVNKFSLAGKEYQQSGNKPLVARSHALIGAALIGKAGAAYWIPPDTRKEELTLGISHLHGAIANYSEADNPEPWAEAHFTLGETLLQFPDTDQTKNAVAAFQAALRIYKPETNHEFWLKSTANLGLAIARAIEVGTLPMTWAGQSVAASRTALKAADDRFPILRAYAASSLGRMLVMELAVENNQGTVSVDADVRLDEALEHLTNALDVFTEQSRPNEWGEIQSTLAAVFMRQSLLAAPGEASALLRASVEAAQAALRVIDSDDANGQFAAHLLLSRAHQLLASAEGCENVALELYRAIESIDIAIPLLGPEHAAMKSQLEDQRAEIVRKRADA